MRLVHSYSSLKLYEQCGLRYYRQRILKDVHEQETVYTTHGHNVHTAIENNLNDGTAFPPELAAYVGPAAAITSGTVLAGGLLDCEQNIGLDREYNPTSYWGDAVWLRSKIDVLVKPPESIGADDNKPRIASVIDWKTGKRRVDFTQLKIAAISVFKTVPGLDEVRTAFVWLKDKMMDKAVYVKEELPGLIEELTPRLLAIEEAQKTNVWKPKPSYLCTYCPCKSTCNYALK